MKVLIADDEAVSRRLLESLLRRWGYDVIVASDGLEASRILQSPGAPKLVVFDLMMPGLDGAQLCREIRERKDDPYTYILLLTGKRSKGDVIEGLEAGADDYITKPFEPQELKVRMRTGKRILCLQDQLIAAREALRDMAMHDSLTGLRNRAAIMGTLAAEVARVQRHGSSVGIALADLDYFKAINDAHGHAVGDAVLSETARTMERATRPYDSVGRHGGEEFLIVLPGCDEINAVSHAERLRAAISELSVETPSGPAQFTISLGVTVFDQNADPNPNTLVRTADEALYRAKNAGRNRVEFARCPAAQILSAPITMNAAAEPAAARLG
jgi:diguanylate cyclase (GGDEF)-like protein